MSFKMTDEELIQMVQRELDQDKRNDQWRRTLDMLQRGSFSRKEIDWLKKHMGVKRV